MMSFSHIALNVRNLEQSIRFYTSTLSPLSFRLVDSVEKQFARITNGCDAVIVLAQVGDTYCDRGYHRKAIGLAHIALGVESRTQVDEMAHHLTGLGVPLLGSGKVDLDYRRGYYAIFFEDPDRIMIELVFHDAYYFSTLPP